jgi:hypothetical protein
MQLMTALIVLDFRLFVVLVRQSIHGEIGLLYLVEFRSLKNHRSNFIDTELFV